MATHVKVLGVLYIALSALGLLAALFISLIFGVASGIVGANAEPHEVAIALPIIGLTGTMLVVFLVIISLPGLVAGIGLLRFRPWARILAIVMAVIPLIPNPFFTTPGDYSLSGLFQKDTERVLPK